MMNPDSLEPVERWCSTCDVYLTAPPNAPCPTCDRITTKVLRSAVDNRRLGGRFTELVAHYEQINRTL